MFLTNNHHLLVQPHHAHESCVHVVMCLLFQFHNPARLESIMLQNLPIMLFGISLIFCLLCLFLCFLNMDYADISCI